MNKLNPLLRLAAISGVETAIRLHIRRGDDLNAIDSTGATPLILAASRQKKAAVKLLLDAGANPMLVDHKGMDALAHAIKSGCVETMAILTEALAHQKTSNPSDKQIEATSEPEVGNSKDSLSANPETEKPGERTIRASSVAITTAAPAPNDQPTMQIKEAPAPVVYGISGINVPEVISREDPDVITLDDRPLEALSADDWEAEKEISVPDGDESVVDAARQVHESIMAHQVENRDEDWADIDIYLPDRATPLSRAENRSAIRDFFLNALREGAVSRSHLIETCLDTEGNRNKEAERLLTLVAGELGASIVEWQDSDAGSLSEPSMEEELLLTDAIEFLEDLSSGSNDPFRYYAKDMRGELLDADEEIALFREMEDAGHAALAALALWPDGLSAILNAAERVTSGEAEAESFSAGPDPSANEESFNITHDTELDEHDESGFSEEALFFLNAVADIEGAIGNTPKLMEALNAARLTRGFLMGLGFNAGQDHAGEAFIEALRRQEKARERMILCNLRLALYIAKKHLWSGIPLDDLVQEANIGLMKAVERFDWRKGFRFSTYATWWIRQQITRSISNTSRVVRAPIHIQETARKVLRERESAVSNLGRPETIPETARRINMPIHKVQMLVTLFEEADSLDETVTGMGISGKDSLIDEMTLDPADIAEAASLRSTLFKMLADLDERSRDVIVMRFGILDDDAKTLEEVGQRFGVTRERIRQIESKSMRKLSHQSKREILWQFLGDKYDPSNTPWPHPTKTTNESGTINKTIAEAEVKSPCRETNQVSGHIVIPEPVISADQKSDIADEARALGLQVYDQRAEGKGLRIIAPYNSSPHIWSFARRLIASGFRRIEEDVFVK